MDAAVPAMPSAGKARTWMLPCRWQARLAMQTWAFLNFKKGPAAFFKKAEPGLWHGSVPCQRSRQASKAAWLCLDFSFLKKEAAKNKKTPKSLIERMKK